MRDDGMKTLEIFTLVQQAKRLLDSPDMGGKNYHEAVQCIERACKMMLAARQERGFSKPEQAS
jgi:hypothetical protein